MVHPKIKEMEEALDGSPQMGLIFEVLDDEWYQILDALLEECTELNVPDDSKDKFNSILQANHEKIKELMNQENLNRVSVFKNFHAKRVDAGPVDPNWGERFSEMDDEDLSFWYAISAEIMDFSVLGHNVRDWVADVWQGVMTECNKRNLDAPFLCEYK